MRTYDVIVAGVGGVGSAALYEAARRGLRAVGIDRFSPGHDRGSSHGVTRVIRQAYFEHPSYVPLLEECYRQWAEFQQECGQDLMHQVGLLEVGPADGIVLTGVRQSARQYGLEVDDLSAADVHRDFPGFRVPPSFEAVFERRAGLLYVERCVQALAGTAQRLGAQIVDGEAVVSWDADDQGVRVVTDRQTYEADRLIVAAGAWSSELFQELDIPLRVLRKHLYWLKSPLADYRADRGCPTYLFEMPEGVFYGFPAVDGWGVKVGEHSRGSLVTDPLNDLRLEEPEDVERVRQFVSQCMPQVAWQAPRRAVCFYTMSPDEHFVVDLHPGQPRVAFAAGLSGHGFKFVNVLGRALVDLVTEGKSDLSIDFLNCRRESLR